MVHNPHEPPNSVTLVRGDICFRTSSFCESVDIPLLSMTWLREIIDLLVNSDLLRFRMSLAEQIFAKIVSIECLVLLCYCHKLY